MVGNVKIPLLKALATRNLQYDLGTCKAYEAVREVEPVDELVQTASMALMIQNFPLYKILDPIS
ncbi:hypothetical protein DOTSEDRAFT_73582 [Dothistroma septosporum NZE10]|uniref:Uncharacterized protein n=1 Tax=Dothistroma septosporum (strain NZE10 / CBS 128990) TaxID=675120 RepID=N1PFT7_DOTSN|nr:hypothetical protein DOTSEDRAFT_73582 [Dothistroma septosporum NZE10]